MTAESPLPRIALVNVSSDTNRGACALTWASLDLIRAAFPQSPVAILPLAETPPSPDAFRHTLRRYPELEVLPPLFDGEGRGPITLVWRLMQSLHELVRFVHGRPNGNRALEWIRNCDLVVSVGGLNFHTYEGTLRGDARFLIRVLPLLAAHKIDVPSVFVGAQVGPFESRFGRWLFRRIAAKASALFPRDRVSADEVQKRVTTHAASILMPDSAFSLELPPGGAEDSFARHGLDSNGATLALVVSSGLRSDESSGDHVALFAQIARALLDSGRISQVAIVVQVDEDRAISNALAERLQLDFRFLIDDDLDPAQLSAFYGACRMVVSSRLHAVILSLLAGTPAVSLAPEATFKERAVLDLVGLETHWVPTSVGPERAAKFCLRFLLEEDQHRPATVAAVVAARARLGEIRQLLRELVKAKSASVDSGRRSLMRNSARQPLATQTPSRS